MKSEGTTLGLFERQIHARLDKPELLGYIYTDIIYNDVC